MSNRLVTERTQKHFDAIALKLDWWARRNRYYYQDLDRLHQFLIPAGSKVLEIGCGTGDLLAKIDPSVGVGIDFSSVVINLAKTKHPQLNFYCLDAEDLNLENWTEYPLIATKFDYIILSEVLGDLTNIQQVLANLQQFCHPHTKIAIDFHNFLWEPILHFAEKIGQRRPQPPQSWLSMNDVLNLLNITGYQSVKIGRRCLLPKYIPIVSNFVNRYLSPLPIVNHFGLTNYIVARKQIDRRQTSDYTVSVIIPARNEAGNIAAAIDRLPQLGKQTEVIFVEGHSQDDTWAKIQAVVSEYRGDFILKAFQQTGKGKGDAVRLGFDRATGDILIILDADLTVQPEELVNFVDAIVSGRGEFINGSRLIYPYSQAAMPWLNTLANKFFALVFSFLLGQNIKDTLCGTKVLWREDYLRICANRSYFGEFDPFGDFDLLFGAAKLNLHIVEVPVRYQPRTYGESNIAHVREGLVLLKMCLYAAQKIKFV
jgi:ubiquinone/menaquinone biosynthesis C-methylase UbiE